MARLRDVCRGYGEGTGPMREEQLEAALTRRGVVVERYAFRSRAGGFALRWGGVYAIAVDTRLDRLVAGFVLRHEMYHVVSGDVDDEVGVAYVDGRRGLWSAAERAADCVALADLVAGCGRVGKEESCARVAQVLAMVAAGCGWDDRWQCDRLRLLRRAGLVSAGVEGWVRRGVRCCGAPRKVRVWRLRGVETG
jgi:hypothetical protein